MNLYFYLFYNFQGIASYLHDSNTFVKWSFRMLRNSQSKVILSDTIYNYLWNLSDPIVKNVNKIAPGIVPISNIGVLNTVLLFVRMNNI